MAFNPYEVTEIIEPPVNELVVFVVNFKVVIPRLVIENNGTDGFADYCDQSAVHAGNQHDRSGRQLTKSKFEHISCNRKRLTGKFNCV